MSTYVQAAVLQFPVTLDVDANLARLLAALERLDAGTLSIGPEGALSGYSSAPDFVTAIDTDATARAIDITRAAAVKRGLHVIVGACLFDDGAWWNASLYMTPDGEIRRYCKINLARSERGTFRSGDRLPVFDSVFDGESVRIAIQMCREIRYPEQWRVLAMKGAQIIAHLNNAIDGRQGHAVWRSHLISRAAEIQRFVLSANNAARDQLCPTMIVEPSGDVQAEMAIGVEGSALARLEISQVSDWVVGQARDDVVAVRALDGDYAAAP